MKQIVANTAPGARPCLWISYGFKLEYGMCSQKKAIVSAARNEAIELILDVM